MIITAISISALNDTDGHRILGKYIMYWDHTRFIINIYKQEYYIILIITFYCILNLTEFNGLL